MGAGLVFVAIYIAIIWLLDYLGGYTGSVEFNGHVSSLTDVLVSVLLLGGSVVGIIRFFFTKKKSELFWAIIMLSDFILIVLNVYFGIRLFK